MHEMVVQHSPILVYNRGGMIDERRRDQPWHVVEYCGVDHAFVMSNYRRAYHVYGGEGAAAGSFVGGFDS